MLRREEITVYNYIKDKLTGEDTYNREYISKVFINKESGRILRETGLLDKYNIYLSIPYSLRYKSIEEYKRLPMYEKSNYYTLEPKKTYIVKGHCTLDYSDYSSKSEFLDALNQYETYLVATVDEYTHCSKSLWHIEVGGV